MKKMFILMFLSLFVFSISCDSEESDNSILLLLLGAGSGSGTTLDSAKTLANLTVSSGILSPVFNSGTTSYKLEVANGVSSLNVTPTATSAKSSINVNGLPVTSGDASPAISLSVGSNSVSIVVIAENNSTNNYTIDVTRLAAAAVSTNADLANLTMSIGTFSPVFHHDTITYTSSVNNATTSITVTPTTAGINATITVNGSAVASGDASQSISLDPGDNAVTVQVTAEDGGTTKTYTLTVSRPNPNLSSLSLSNGTLGPSFDKDVISYTAAVANDITSITVTPTAADSNSTITVNGSSVTSGNASQSISLSVGENTITTIVTAADGSTTKTYTVVVTRLCSSLMGGTLQGCPLSLSYIVTTIAGPAQGSQTTGDTDGTGNAARFNTPGKITTDGTNIFLADRANNKIRKIVISTGVVTTIAGPVAGTTTPGDADGTGNAASFNGPMGITTDGTNLYVAEYGNHKIRKIVISSGVVTTLAGPAPGTVISGDADGTGTSARFNVPLGITTDGTNLYVADGMNNKIRKIVISTGVVTTIAGPAAGTTTSGDADGTGSAARFNAPAGITTDGTDIYVAEMMNSKIRKIVISSGVVTTFAGPAPGATTTGDTDDTGNAARFYQPVAIITDGTNLYVPDGPNHKIRKIVISTRVVTTVAGPAQGTTTPGDTDGTGNAARFNAPGGITSDGICLYISEIQNHKIRKIE